MGYFRHGDFGSAERSRLRAAFKSAQPFPHAVLDDFVAATPDEVLPAFPSDDWEGWVRPTEPYQTRKAYCSDIEAIPSPLCEMLHELGASSFLQFLEEVGGLEGLIPDPHLDGGGLHMSGAGGILTPHTDGHVYPRLGLYRRLNVIIYLNPDWRAEYGGNLALYDGEQKAASIVPIWGRCVVFVTDGNSVHGFPEPIANGHVRRSIATFYYTSHEAPRYSGGTAAHWRQHSEKRMGPAASRIRLRAYEGLLFGSRGLARVAHAVNPDKRRAAAS